uniref:Legume lectin domain-containing protein n=1 Tax=Daucus carota subsp. sativus TaxID=79200 RepID=A0A162B2C1_DAUCS
MGRATYYQPMTLWDDRSGNLTDFTTHFSFIINSQNRTKYGDGMAFFLAPVGSKIPRTATKGGSLGLTTDEQPLNSTDNPFIAVEFDVYTNPGWDPVGEHVGIDLSSMKSVTNVSWLGGKSSVLEGLKNEAWITYQSSSKNLSVVFTALSNNRTVNQSLSYMVDLKDYLPQNVTFGFSASTGNQSAICGIYTWGFNTSLELHESYLTDQAPTSSNDNAMLIGFVAGGVTAFCVALLALAYYIYRRNREDSEDEIAFDDTMDGEFERCTGPKRQAIHVLNLDAPLPILPPTMPVATYYAPLNMSIAPLAIAYGQNVWRHRLGESSGNYNTESSSYASIDSAAPSVLFPR